LIEAHWTLVKDDQGQPRSVLAINTDITDRKKLEAQLYRAQRMESIGTLASGIAHDLNNVLSPILLAVGMLKQQPRSAGEMKMLNLLESSAQHGADLVRQVLSFARGVEGQRQTVDVSRIVNELEKMIRDTFDPKIRLSVEMPKELWPISGDPTELHQSLLNLCVNARDAMPNGGRLQLTLANVILDEQYATMHAQAKAGPYVMIKVSDTGSGISPSIRERIFDPFFTTKEVGKGTGLGLATVQAVVKSHGGFLNLYSEEGTGTVFTLYFPGLEGISAAQAGTMEVKLPRGQGEVVLVIDDEAAVRTITQQTLEAFGYRVLLAEDGAEALSIYVQNRDEIAVVLTDMMMPIIDGYSTIQALMRINSQVKIIAASGLASHDMVSKAMSAGVKHFIPKPYSAETLLQTLAEAIGDSRT
jgi:nitrogen-specific signal transduction histidine kinase/ActR/RegA family two-component response regulator